MSGECQESVMFPSRWLFSALKTRFRGFSGFSGPVGSGKIRLPYANAGRVGIVGAPTFAWSRT
jgi:hypothetical protein